MERTIETIRRDIRRLFESNPNIHVNVTMRHPKINVHNGCAVIKGVYPNIFQIEENDNGYTRCHSVQYNDVLIGRVEVLELMDSFSE